MYNKLAMKRGWMMELRRFSKTSLAMFLCAGLFSAQTALPILHDWHVAVEESAAHRFDRMPDLNSRVASLDQPQDHPGHSHHDPSTCPVDRFLLSNRNILSFQSIVTVVSSPISEFLSLELSPLARDDLRLSGSSPRAPPL